MLGCDNFIFRYGLGAREKSILQSVDKTMQEISCANSIWHQFLYIYKIFKLQGISLPQRGEHDADIDRLTTLLLKARNKEEPASLPAANLPPTMPPLGTQQRMWRGV